MKTYVTIALLQLATGQQKVELVEVRSAVVMQHDGGVATVGDGAWLSTAALIADAKLHEDLQAQNKNLVEHSPDVPYAWVAAALAVGMAVGIAGTLALKQ